MQVINEQIAQADSRLAAQVKADLVAQRLMTVPGVSREQRDQRTLVSPEDRSLHLPACHDELLAQKDILHRQFGPRTQQVSRETTDNRARSRSQRFAHNLRRAGQDRLRFGDDTSEHETDLPRDPR